MFDIGFWELTLIAIVALLVVGPDKLPGVARTAGMWVGRMRRFVTNVKEDIDRELRQEELRKALARDAGLEEIKQIMNTDAFTLEEETPASKQTPMAAAAEAEDPVALAERLAADDNATGASVEAGETGLDNEAGQADPAETTPATDANADQSVKHDEQR